MPEWTGTQRDELYALLADGRFDDALAFVTPFESLKLNDLKPVNKTAFAVFDVWLAGNLEAQRNLARLLDSPRRGIRALVKLIYGGCTRLSGEVLAERFQEVYEATHEQLVQEQQQHIENMISYYRTTYRENPAQAEDKIQEVLSRERHLDNPPAKLRDLLVALRDLILKFPTPQGLHALRNIHPDILQTAESDLAKAEKLLTAPAKPQAAPSGSGKKADGWPAELLGLLRQADLEGLRALAGRLGGLTESKLRLKGEMSRAIAQSLEDNPEFVGRLAALLTEPDPALNLLAFAALRTLDPPPADGLAATLIDFASRNEIAWCSGRKVPTAEARRVNLFHELLAGQIDPALLHRYSRISPNDLGQFLVEGYATVLIRRHGFAAVLQAAEDFIQAAIQAQPDPATRRDRYFLVQFMVLREWIIEAQEELDPLFAVSHRLYLFDPMEERKSPAELDAAARREICDFLKTINKKTAPALARWTAERWDQLVALAAEPEFASLLAGTLAACLESGRAEQVTWAFLVALERPALLAPQGRSLLELAALGLWRPKAGGPKLAILRLHALAEHGRCTPAEAAAAIEPAFTIEDPALWRAAAEAVLALKKKDPAIRLADPGRVRELIARDPDKHGQYLQALLG